MTVFSLLQSTMTLYNNTAIVSISGSDFMLEMVTDSAVMRKLKFVRLIDLILILSSGLTAVISGWNTILVSTLVASSSNGFQFDS